MIKGLHDNYIPSEVGFTQGRDAVRDAAATGGAALPGDGLSAANPDTAGAAATPAARLHELLQAYGYKVTDKNLAMLSLMLDNALPLTREQVARMNQALALTDSAEQALFLLQNNIRLTRANAAQLDGLVKGQVRITAQLGELLAAVSALPDPALREMLTRLLASVENAEAGMYSESDTPLQAEEPGPQAPQSEARPTADGMPRAATDAQPDLARQTGAAPPVPEGGKPGTANATSLKDGAALADTAPGTTPGNPDAPPAPPPAARASAPATAEGDAPAASRAFPEEESGVQPPPRFSEHTRAPHPGTAESHNAPGPGREHLRRLSFKLADSKPGDIDRFVNTLRDALGEARRILTESGAETPEAARVLRQIGPLSDHIDFVAQMKNQLFVQLPILHNDRELNTALHIYKDASGKQQRGETQSALIALDTASMGLFETYVQKRGRSVTCQFRLRDDTVERLVRTHIHELDALLAAGHYTLEAFHFLPRGEPYTVLDTPAALEGAAGDDPAMKRTSAFDRSV